MPAEFDFSGIKKRLEEVINEHNGTLDAWGFNGGTFATLICTSLAALFSSKVLGDYPAWAASLSATAGVLVAAERALAFGARWRFHHEMRNGYRSVVDMIDFAALIMDADEKKKYMTDIWAKLYVLRCREANIPGTGNATS